ncbi:hypothetical protein Ahy_B03g066798 [Arachis hypogaea]|uniref:SWIM-type domain-containing protein n=1 Tax=Arachis hypogaea TaxID=3818 RepID=A0A445A573_ARAHY|nr:hypothetical protein Ahy_B03g066798 [Arachis hypogaea]
MSGECERKETFVEVLRLITEQIRVRRFDETQAYQTFFTGLMLGGSKGGSTRPNDRISSQTVPVLSRIRYPVPVFGGFVQFQTKYTTDEASMQEMFSMYIESRAQISFIELYIEFEQSEADRNILREDYNSDIEEEFESNYEVVGPDGDEEQGDDTMAPNVTDVANALANEVPFEEPSFMRVLDLEAMHAPEWQKFIKSFYRLNELFTRKRAEAEARINDGHVFSEHVTSKIHANQLALGNIQVNCFDRQNEVFEVREMPSGVEYAVDLRRQRCDCGEFQVDRILCRHVFACCANQRLDWQVYVHYVFKMDQVRRVYRARFRPLGNLTTWPSYNGPRFVPNPYLRRVSKGRPRMTRFLNEMDTQMLRRSRRCRQCAADGHNRSRCRQGGGPGTDHNAQ